MRRNAYDCGVCGRRRIYKHVDDGVTPMLVKCECGAIMVSRMYRDVPVNEPATHEWYKPSADELTTMTPAMREYIAKGGLQQRRVRE